MRELEVLLALAISMLLFSTVVSTLIEAIARLLRLRGGLLRSMLRTLFEDEVEKKLLGKESIAQLNMQVHKQLDTPYRVLRKIIGLFRNTDNNSLSVQFADQFMDTLGSRTSLNANEFLRKLGDSDVGEAIHKKYQQNINLVIGELAVKFEEFGQEATSIYKKYTGLLNTMVAIAFAIVLNVNVVSLALEFYKNATLTNQMIVSFERMENDIANAAKAISKTDPAEDGEVTLEQIQENIQSIKELGLPIESINNIGFPLEYKNPTYVEIKAKALGKTPEEYLEFKNNKPDQDIDGETRFDFLWMIGNIITGILIGLGAPFWFDIIKRISAIRRVASSVISPSKDITKNDSQAKTESTEAEVAKQQCTESFMASLLARKVVKNQNTHVNDGFNSTDNMIV